MNQYRDVRVGLLTTGCLVLPLALFVAAQARDDSSTVSSRAGGRAAVPRTLLYEFTVDDPHTYAKPWTAQIPMTLTDGRIYENACHQGNCGLANILSGARAMEKKAAEASSKSKP